MTDGNNENTMDTAVPIITDEQFKKALLHVKGRIVTKSTYDQYAPKVMRKKLLTPQYEKVCLMALFLLQEERHGLSPMLI